MAAALCRRVRNPYFSLNSAESDEPSSVSTETTTPGFTGAWKPLRSHGSTV